MFIFLEQAWDESVSRVYISQLFSSAGPSSYPGAVTWLQSNWLCFGRVSHPNRRPDHAHPCNCNASPWITNFLSYLAESLFAKDTTIPSQPSSSRTLSASSSLLPGPSTAWSCVFCLSNSQLVAPCTANDTWHVLKFVCKDEWEFASEYGYAVRKGLTVCYF